MQQKNWGPVYFKPDRNKTLDTLARKGAMQDVWSRLQNLFPMIRAHRLGLLEARHNGSVGRLVNTDDRFVLIRKPMGPENKEEWVLLAQACIEAMYGVIVSETELDEYRYFGPYKYDPYRIHNAQVEARKRKK